MSKATDEKETCPWCGSPEWESLQYDCGSHSRVEDSPCVIRPYQSERCLHRNVAQLTARLSAKEREVERLRDEVNELRRNGEQGMLDPIYDNLPEGWELKLSWKDGCLDFSLFNPDGCLVEFDDGELDPRGMVALRVDYARVSDGLSELFNGERITSMFNDHRPRLAAEGGEGA